MGINNYHHLGKTNKQTKNTSCRKYHGVGPEIMLSRDPLHCSQLAGGFQNAELWAVIKIMLIISIIEGKWYFTLNVFSNLLSSSFLIYVEFFLFYKYNNKNYLLEKTQEVLGRK